MSRLPPFSRLVILLALGFFAAYVVVLRVVLAHSLPAPALVQINEDGFGDCQNAYSWSMAWFRGKLYVGTSRGIQVIADPDFHCQGNGLAAEIWRYTPEINMWDRVFKSPNDVPIPGRPDELAARDNGFRDMIVFREANGTEGLYVGGVIYPFPGDLRRPRILRSTDGVTFEPIPQDPGTFLGDLEADSFRAMAVYKGRLYVTAGSMLGEGVILEAEHPAGGNNNFRQVSPPGLLAFELDVFNGFLYVGTATLGNGPDAGFSVFKTEARPGITPYYTFIPVVTHGAFGKGFLAPNSAVLSMKVFRGRLYVGGLTDLIRINADDTWDLVVGDPRQTPDGDKFPISGLPAGFGNPFTGHLWRMQRHGPWFFVGTWDFSVFFRDVPIIGRIAALEAGFDLWTTRDGVFWFQITRNGFGNIFNHGVRSLESTPFGLFVGTANDWNGTQVWLAGGDSPARHRGPAVERGQISLKPPERLEGESRGGVTVLSWAPAPGARRFGVFRATYRPNREVGITQLPQDTWIPGPFTRIGTTAQFFFQDPTAVDEARYAYYVRAEDREGELSDPSNVVMVPSVAPVGSIDHVRATILDLAGRGKVKAVGGEAGLLRLLAVARAAAASGNLPRARWWLEALHRQVGQNPGEALDSLSAEELEIMVAKLVRRVSLAQAGVIPVRDVLESSAR
ncbi:MAG: hypothetical protein HY725_10820 [Candidatus Rokubacteria bacterium]|nr:hypothetical protein [Candidatus Rokubacteria bacterium]